MSQAVPIEEDAPGKEPSLGLLLFQLRRAVQVYNDTGSRYARLRARELVADMRTCLQELDQVLAMKAGLVERYRSVVQGEQVDDTL